MRVLGVAAFVLLAPQAFAGDITVRVDGDSDTRLEEAVVSNAATIHWETSCIAPCFTHVSPYALVRARASLPSRPLKLGGEDTALRVWRGNADAAEVSTASIILGSLLLGAASIATPISTTILLEHSYTFCLSNCPVHDETPVAVFAGSLIATAVGLVVLATGLVMRPSARARVSLALTHTLAIGF